MDEYLEQRDDLRAGRTPRRVQGEATVAGVCDAFLVHCRRKVDAGEMVERTYTDYRHTTDRIVAAFGKRTLVASLHPNDFAALRAEVAKTHGPVALGNFITRTPPARSLFPELASLEMVLLGSGQ